MELEKLFLTKEELPILYENCFQIPIHPRLLDENININKNIAKNIFPKVAEDWYNDLKEHVKTEKDKEKRRWIKEVFLKEEPKITKEFNDQIVNGFWKDDFWTMDNGFVTGFSISRNAGGSLYFNKDDFNCETLIPGIYIKFSESKVKEFECEKIKEYSQVFTYAPHNIDYYPGALFLRNWAIRYMNEVFKEVFK